ncbi:MAG: histidine triad nucleotide-binding protein [bacterium]|nr:histidine triad nucleotide-binding protein [bacterium]
MMDCLFCKIANGEIESDFVYEDERVVAFPDINPQAPAHVLIIPREHISGMGEIDESNSDLAGHLLNVAAKLARELGVAETGYRLVFNNGRDGGQTVDHIHLHLIGGRRLGWPPG